MKPALSPTYARLTATRFFAAALVVIFHYGQSTFPFDQPYIRPVVVWGQVSVSYFFCLSGFILTAVYGISEKLPVVSFITARLARIMPGYLTALALIWLFTDVDWSVWAPHVFAIQPWFPSLVADLNVPGWSVGVELFFYALFPVIFFVMMRRPTWQVAAFSFVLWAATVVIHAQLFKHFFFTHNLGWGGHFLGYWPPMHLNEFMLGCAGGLLAARLPFKKSYAFDVLGTLAAGAILYVLEFSHEVLPWISYRDTILTGLLAPLMVVFLFSLPRMKLFVWDLLRWTPLFVLGEASYALYIFQHPVLWAFNHAPFFWVIPTDVRFLYYAGFLVMASVFFFVMVEAPFRDSVRSVVRKTASFLNRFRVVGTNRAI